MGYFLQIYLQKIDKKNWQICDKTLIWHTQFHNCFPSYYKVSNTNKTPFYKLACGELLPASVPSQNISGLTIYNKPFLDIYHKASYSKS